MDTKRLAQSLLWLAALYDGGLGLVFLVAGPALYEATGVTPPNHWGYIHFPAALLVVFGLMFASAAARPAANANLIPYGILLKIAYCATVFGHWLHAGLPWIWKPFAWLDLAWIFVLWWIWRVLRGEAAARG
jgi:hypothetical protein